MGPVVETIPAWLAFSDRGVKTIWYTKDELQRGTLAGMLRELERYWRRAEKNLAELDRLLDVCPAFVYSDKFYRNGMIVLVDDDVTDTVVVRLLWNVAGRFDKECLTHESFDFLMRTHGAVENKEQLFEYAVYWVQFTRKRVLNLLKLAGAICED
jgi:hypothetical protein